MYGIVAVFQSHLSDGRNMGSSVSVVVAEMCSTNNLLNMASMIFAVNPNFSPRITEIEFLIYSSPPQSAHTYRD